MNQEGLPFFGFPVAILLLGVLLPASLDAREPYAATYQPKPADPVLIRNVTVLTGTGARLEHSDVYLAGGRIAALGEDLPVDNARIVEGAGRWLTPGIIDVHSHLGDYPSPAVPSTSDGNEMTGPNASHVWAEHSV